MDYIIVSVNVGEEAVDWAAILVRMYTRWFERAGVPFLKPEPCPESELLHVLSWQFSAGYLTADPLAPELGIHRLVRISPFDGQSRRHTSFAKVVRGTYSEPEREEVLVRSYILHPVPKVQDHRTNFERSDAEAVLNGDLTGFIPVL